MSSHPKSSSILSLFKTISSSKRDLFDDAVLKEGWSFKKSCIATQYKKRWIVLQGTKLSCYPSQNIGVYTNANKSPGHKTQTFNLSLYRFKVEKDSKSPFKFFLINLSVTNGSNQVTFKTLTKQDCDEWIFKLQEAIISCNLSKYRGLAPLYSTFESAVAGADSDDSLDDTDSDEKNDENVYPDSKFDSFRIRTITISSPHSQSQFAQTPTPTEKKQSAYVENEANVLGIKIMTPQNEDTAKKNSKKRQQIEKEIIDSEETYYYGISTLLNELLIPMFEHKLVDENLYFKAVTSSIPNLVAFHQLFLEQLTEAYKNSYGENNTPILNNNTPIAEDDKYQSIAEVFNAQNKEEFISIYLTFITQYKTILDLFGTFHGNVKLQSFLREKRENMKPLSNFLILPVQRMPRYLLLLARLKKNSFKWSADYNDIECALHLVEEICAEINERKRKIENLSQCLQIQQCLTNLKETIVDQKRSFLKQFVFIKKENKRQRIFFVFNDMIIIGNKRWSVKEIIDNMRTVDIKHDENDKNFALIHGNNQCVYSAISQMEINEFKHIIRQNRLQLMDLDVLEITGKKNVKEIRSKIREQRDSNSNDFKIQQMKHLQLIYLIKNAYFDYKDAKGKIPSNVQLFLRFCKNKKNIGQANCCICEQVIKEMQTNDHE